MRVRFSANSKEFEGVSLATIHRPKNPKGDLYVIGPVHNQPEAPFDQRVKVPGLSIEGFVALVAAADVVGIAETEAETMAETATEDSTVVRDFVSIVGSTVVGSTVSSPNDTDILIRADRVENVPTPLVLALCTGLAGELRQAAEALDDADAEEELATSLRQRAEEVDAAVDADAPPGFFIRAEDIELPVRNYLDPEKKGIAFHWSANPQGAHSESAPFGDLVLRFSRERE